MTEIENKALELVNEVCAERDEIPYYEIPRDDFSIAEALCRSIEQHEAYKQDVSDAVVAHKQAYGIEEREVTYARLSRFIIPKPTVDPLAVALAEWEGVPNHGRGYAHDAKVFRAALAKRGLKIVEVER